MNKEVIFDKEFFKRLNQRWLKTYEIFLLLQSIEELHYNNIIQITSSIPSFIKPEFQVFFIPSDFLDDWPKIKFSKTSKINLKVNGLYRVHCLYSVSKELNLRVYSLIPNGKYSFLHYRVIGHRTGNNKLNNSVNNSFDFTNSCFNGVLKIINFSPKFTYEKSNKAEEMLIILESSFTLEQLKKLAPCLKIRFGALFTNCTNVLAQNIITCNIPAQAKAEVKIEIYYNNILAQHSSYSNLIKVSTYDLNFESNFIYKPEEPAIQLSKVHNVHSSKSNYSIFNFTNTELTEKLLSLIKLMLSHITFYSFKIINCNKETDIINFDKLISNPDERNIIESLKLIHQELSSLNKAYLLDCPDTNGYSIVHYITALNYPNALQLLSQLNIDIEIKSENGLTAYEICAGRRNLESLVKLIEIFDNDSICTGGSKSNFEEKTLFNYDVLKSALNIALDKKSFSSNDIEVLDLLIKQIKIKYIVNMTSGKIIKDTPNFEKNNFSENDSIKKIQSSVRGWLKRNQYKNMKKGANKLIEKFKTHMERKKFLETKSSVIFIQHQIRKWLEKEHNKQ